MKKHYRSGTTWFICLSLLAFAFIFLISSLAFNSLFTANTSAKRTRSMPAAKTTTAPGYTIVETADPFVTKVIKN